MGRRSVITATVTRRQPLTSKRFRWRSFACGGKRPPRWGQRSTHARRRWGRAGPCWGAGSRRGRTARTAARWCCAGSPRTRRRSRCPSSCTRPGRSGTTWRVGCTRTLRGGERGFTPGRELYYFKNLCPSLRSGLRTLAGVRVSSLCGSPRRVLVKVLAALAIQSNRVVIAHAASVDLRTQTDTQLQSAWRIVHQ